MSGLGCISAFRCFDFCKIDPVTRIPYPRPTKTESSGITASGWVSRGRPDGMMDISLDNPRCSIDGPRQHCSAWRWPSEVTSQIMARENTGNAWVPGIDIIEWDPMESSKAGVEDGGVEGRRPVKPIQGHGTGCRTGDKPPAMLFLFAYPRLKPYFLACSFPGSPQKRKPHLHNSSPCGSWSGFVSSTSIASSTSTAFKQVDIYKTPMATKTSKFIMAPHRTVGKRSRLACARALLYDAA